MYKSILFVCTGNICRSPTAHGMLRQQLKEHDLDHIRVDSAGLSSFHSGSPPDPRAISAAQERGYALDNLSARRFGEKDFSEFELIVAMDSNHLQQLKQMSPPHSSAIIKLHSEFATNPVWIDVPDPYYGGREHFDKAFDLIENGVDGLLKELKQL